MKKTQSIILTSTLIAMLETFTIVQAAQAQDESKRLAMLEALSYAPQNTFNDERFAQFDIENDDYYEHELNDAWLGMPAHDIHGKLIGFIEDAILDENGYITKVFIGLSNSEINIKIDGEFAELTSEKVKLELTKQQVAEISANAILANNDNASQVQ